MNVFQMVRIKIIGDKDADMVWKWNVLHLGGYDLNTFYHL